jgi:hypothetical protein
MHIEDAKLCFADKEQGNVLLAACKQLSERIHGITEKKKFFAKIKRWIYEDAFGTIDQV